jgi:hypothetical protein
VSAVLFRNVTIWDGIGDEPYPGEVVVEGNRIRVASHAAAAKSLQKAPPRLSMARA